VGRDPSRAGVLKTRRLAAAVVAALLGPLPLPHIDNYQPLALGLWAAAMNLEENGPVYLALMTAVFLVYTATFYGVLSLIAHARARKAHPREASAPPFR
jgi:hypothetical protein